MATVDDWGGLLPGQSVAGYRITRKLGQGGFGIAYDAINDDLGQRAAIKEFYPRELVGRSGTTVTVRDDETREFYSRFLGRFVEEARTLNRLDHPNIVKMRHFERANNTAYVVMDYIDGVTLRAWLEARRGKLDEVQLRSIFFPIMDALEHVHGEDLLHRDLSPLNIMVDGRGKPWLIDFGAFKSMWRDQPRRTTVLAANPAYAPPEQVDEMSGQSHGAFTDVYGLAATMYDAIAGTRPVPAASRTTALAYGRPDPLRPLGEVATVRCSDALKAAVMRALMIHPDARTPSIAAFRSEAGWAEQAGERRDKTTKSEMNFADVDRAIGAKPADADEQPAQRVDGAASSADGPAADTALAIGWLVLSVALFVGVIAIFNIAKLDPFGIPDGPFLAGLLIGTLGSLSAAAIMSLKRRPPWKSAEMAIYWFGSAAFLGFMTWPALDILKIVRSPASGWVGLAVFCAAALGYFAKSVKRS